MERNPYAAPQTRVDDTDAPLEMGEVASRTRRLLNVIIDTGGYFVLSMIIGVVLAIVYPPALEALDHTGPAADYALGFGIMALYYIPLEALFGRTLGKWLTGTRVVDESGDQASLPKILGRTAARFIPFEVFSFLGSSGIGWHDKYSGTRVVRVRKR
jgi:uncharacterized RDD family membrane protein YckC